MLYFDKNYTIIRLEHAYKVLELNTVLMEQKVILMRKLRQTLC